MNGVVNVYKEKGLTSFDVVAAVRRITGVKKCGHLGTLDPMAEGVLPICLGYATRFADYLSATDKEYIAEFQLGIATDSFDTTGTTIGGNTEIVPSYEEVETALKVFIGKVSLKVPAFSAKKINGVRAYKLARNGELEDAGQSEMTIDEITLFSYDYPLGIMKVSCGKGTYIRSIIHQLGEMLGTGGAMSGLIRSRNGTFLVKDAYKLDDLRTMAAGGRLASAVTSVTQILPYPCAVVKDSHIKSVLNGMAPERSAYLSLPIESDESEFFITDKSGTLLALGSRAEASAAPLKLKMVFN